MERAQRLRRVVLLMTSFLRNLAYLRAFQAAHARIPMNWTRDFWVTHGGNCTDIAILEWCKLFADRGDKHHWSKVLAEPDLFKLQLLGELQMDVNAYDDYVASVRRYRDKFVAHLDSDDVMNIPMLDIAKRAIDFYHQQLTSKEMLDQGDILHPLPASGSDLAAYFDFHSEAAAQIYKQVLSPQT